MGKFDSCSSKHVLDLVGLSGPIGGPACFSQTLLAGSLNNPHKNYGVQVFPLNMVLGLVVHRGHQLQCDISPKWRTKYLNQASAKHGLLSFTWFVIFFFFLFQCSNRLRFQPYKSKTNGPRVTKFGTLVYLGNVQVDLEYQGHRSKVKVRRSKNVFTRHSVWASLLEYEIEPWFYIEPWMSKQNHASMVPSITVTTPQRALTKVHWPPMNNFVCKLQGYIVYFSKE